jgi:hypothetical protein
MVKLNIEMSMASLVVRLAQGRSQNDMDPEAYSSTDPQSHLRSGQHARRVGVSGGHGINGSAGVKSIQLTSRSKKGGVLGPGLSKIDSDESLGGIECRTDLNVTVEHVKGDASSRSSHDAPVSVFGDETPLHRNGVRVMERQL